MTWECRVRKAEGEETRDCIFLFYVPFWAFPISPHSKKTKKSQGSEQQCECRNAFGEDQKIVGEIVRTMVMAKGSFSSKLYQLPNPHSFLRLRGNSRLCICNLDS